MIKVHLDRPHLRFLAYAFIPLLVAACSGNDGDSGFREAQRTYEEATASRTAELAGPIVAAYVELRASGGSLDDSFARRFRDEISTFTASLCDQIKALGEKAGSGDTRSSRLDDVRVTSEDLVQDGFARALLEKVLGLPADQRDKVFDALGLKAGAAGLKSAGLLDVQGQVTIPQRRTDQYVRYERWLHTENPGLAGTISILGGNARDEIDRCASSA